MRTEFFVLLSVCFHGCFLWSIFSLYFQSPVVEVGARSTPDLQRRLADRLIFIVGDGLRADKLFQLYPSPPFSSVQSLPNSLLPYFQPDQVLEDAGLTTPAPFLRSLILNGSAAWGISHTRVPTESRPGHVALLAGMYEDPSAVLKGWKVNPIQFDSVLSASPHAYAMGSPDIVPLFKGPKDNHVDTWQYSSEMEDFTKDAVELDVWVLDKFAALLANTSEAATLRQPGTMIFLHLLGLDTTGHAYRPQSMEYFRNIQAVDALLKRVVQLVQEFFEDDRTAFIFTADHGMSNIGNHGDGNPDSTRTPLVAWGAGISSSLARAQHSFNGHDAYSSSWQLSATMRTDMDQADVAALSTALLGNPFPANSVGRVPLDYLVASLEEKARILFANAQGILRQFSTKQDFKVQHALRYVPFRQLPVEPTAPLSVESRLSKIESLLDEGSFDAALSSADDLIDVALKGIRYIHGYDWIIIQALIVAGYVGWMLYSAVFVLHHYVALPGDSMAASSAALYSASGVFAMLAGKFAKERAPLVYYLYAAFPCFFWGQVASARRHFKNASLTRRNVVFFAFVLAAMELCVVGYFRRAAWSVGLVLIGVVWPLVAFSPEFMQQNRGAGAAWTVSCLITAVFPVLPVEKGESLPLICCGALLAITVCGLASYRTSSLTLDFQRILAFHTGCMIISLAVTLASSFSLNAKRGLPLPNQVIAWLLLFTSFLTPSYIVHRIANPTQRIIALIFAFIPVYTILTTSYELLFLCSFSLTLLLWLLLERRLDDHRRATSPAKSKTTATSLRRLTLEDVRRAVFLLFFIHVGFFATGNIASVSSFYLQPVYRLVGQFMPFLMAALLLYKIFIPFLVVAAVVHGLNRELGLPPFGIFLVALSISDVLSLSFFCLVTDQGSWLEIGQSISHFAISNMLLLFMALLFVWGELLMR